MNKNESDESLFQKRVGLTKLDSHVVFSIYWKFVVNTLYITEQSHKDHFIPL